MTDIVPGSTYLPALTLAQAAERRNAIVEFTRMAMHANVDFGVIPGTDKPTLLKPGAEKLCTQFGLSPCFEPVEVLRDWTGKTTDGEPLFFYEYRCRLSRDGRVVGEGIGSCNSWEKKYRWRNADRRCPSCGAPAIKKSKFAPKNTPKNTPPGWYCYAKVGGCGAEFAANEPAIIEQETGQVANPDVADLVNTISKMAQKRALIAATLIALNASEFFTQDMEDMVIDVTPVREPAPVEAQHDPQLPELYREIKAVRKIARNLGVTFDSIPDNAGADYLARYLDDLYTRVKQAQSILSTSANGDSAPAPTLNDATRKTYERASAHAGRVIENWAQLMTWVNRPVTTPQPTTIDGWRALYRLCDERATELAAEQEGIPASTTQG